MGASQRVSRGFHRLALVLAILGFLAVAALTAHIAFDLAEQRQRALDEQLELACAKRELLADIAQAKSQGGRWVPDSGRWDLKELGCSKVSRLVLEPDILNATAPTAFSYTPALVLGLSFVFGLSLLVSVFIYGIGRAIGWVIGGFTAS